MKTSITFLKYKTTLEDAIKEIESTDADYIHVDVMDGKFVDNIFLPNDIAKNLLNNTNKKLDVHLMVENPLPYIELYSVCNTEYITFHKEINKDIKSIIDYIHKKNIKAGLAINPDTKVDDIKDFLSDIELVIIMGVNPGYGGQKLIPETVLKIDELMHIRENNSYNFLIALDGGVNMDTRKLLNNLDILIVGSFVSMSENIQEAIDKIR